ncbi:MAG: energy transducer TonB [Deltaproteobacteria bacterium]|nr:energy transducer TonB [Deltaproteobacteria bacterium]
MRGDNELVRRRISGDERVLMRMLLFSFAVHILVLGGIVIKQRFLNRRGSQFEEKIMAARLLRLGTPPRKLKHREMPRKIPNLPAKRNEALVPGSKKSRHMAEMTTRRRNNDYTREMNKALERIRAQVKTENNRELPDNLPPTPGSPDGVKEGDVIDPRTVNAVNTYVARIGMELRTKGGWNIPSIIPKETAKNLSVTILVILDAQGYILKRELVKSSGNTLFDNAALSTVSNVKKVSAPPPDLPDKIRKELLDEGLEVEFTGVSLR